MGNFYGNVTVLGSSLERVREVAPPPVMAFEEGDTVVVFAEVDDNGVCVSAQLMSEALGAVTFSASVHDDDILGFAVHDGGRVVGIGEVPDSSEYFGLDDETIAALVAEADGGIPKELLDATPDGPPLDAEALVRALGRGDVGAAAAALSGDFVFATERHAALAEALGLPTAAAGWGYRYLDRDSEHYTGPPLTRF